MDKLFTSVLHLFREAHGRGAKSETEAIMWAVENGVITSDEFGAFCIAGLVDDSVQVSYT